MTLEALGRSTVLLGRLTAWFGAARKATSITAMVKRLPLSRFDNSSPFAISRQQCCSIYDSDDSALGRFQIIETMLHASACITPHVVRGRRRLRAGLGSTSVVLVAFVAYFGPALTGSASARAGPPPRPLQTPEMPQYHGPEGGQYHLTARSSAPASASLSRSGEMSNPIYETVISPLFTAHSPNSIPKSMIASSSRVAAPIGRQNDRRIGSVIGGENGKDPSLMLGIAAVLGLVYLAFLAVWFWATRFRVRPPSSAPS